MDPPNYRHTGLSEGNPQWAANARESEARQRELRSERAQQRRAASQTEHRGLGREEALALAAARFPEQAKGRAFDGDHPAPGVRVIDQRGDGAALVTDGEGGRFLLDSTIPLQARTADGAYAPVDLALEHTATGFATKNSHAQARFAREARPKVAFLERSFGVSLDSARTSEGEIRGHRVFFANTHTDTDAWTTALPHGAEFFLQVRSTESPEQFVFDLDLPAGAEVHRVSSEGAIAGDAPQNLEISRAGKPLGYIYSPLAFDADGQVVPTKLTRHPATSRLTLDVDHRDRDVRYPLLVDPEVVVAGNVSAGWHGWSHGQDLKGMPNQPGNQFGWAVNNCAYECNGLYLSMPTRSWFAHNAIGWGQYRAIWGTYLYRAQFGNMRHVPYTSPGYTWNRWSHGIANWQANWWQSNAGYMNSFGGTGPNPFGPAAHADAGVNHDFCFNPRCDRWQGDEEGYALFQLSAYNPYNTNGVYTGDYGKATYTMTWSNMYLGDRRAPWLTSGAPSSRDWYDDGDITHSRTVSAYDEGLGLYDMVLSGGLAGSKTQRHGCGGDPYRSRCPNSWSHTFTYKLPEGTTQLQIWARDAVENQTGRHTWTEKVDRSKPIFTALNGTLYDARRRPDDRRREGLYGASYSLTVAGSDSQSGVRDIDVALLDSGGSRVGGANNSQCSSTCDVNWTLAPDNHPDGEYTVKITLRDRVAGQAGAPDTRHIDTRSFDVTIDRRGDIYHARSHATDPAQDPTIDGEEYARPSSTEARLVGQDDTSTLRLVSCESDEQGCLQRRSRPNAQSSDSPSDEAVATTTGTSHDDARLLGASDLLEGATHASADAAATGSIYDVTRGWQVLPPTHGDGFRRYDATEQVVVDGETTTATDKLYVDSTTGLPVRRISTVGSTTTDDTFYTYDLHRLELHQVSSDFFALAEPAGSGNSYSQQLPPPETESEPEEPAEQSASEQATEARRFRQAFGLNATDSAIQAALSDPSTLAGLDEFGARLTGAELTELRNRVAAQDARDPVDAYGASHPDVFAGSYMDHEAGGLLYVGFTANAENHLAALRTTYAHPERLRTFTAARSLATLQDLRARVSADWRAGALDDIGVVSVGVEQASNVVVVGTPEVNAVKTLQLRLRYGEGVELRQDIVQSAQSSSLGPVSAPSRPFAAGLRIKRYPVGVEDDLDQGPTRCTAGFTVVGRANKGGRLRRQYFKLTAGHCQYDFRSGPRAGYGLPWHHDPKGRRIEVVAHTSRTAYAQRDKELDTDAAILRVTRKYASSLIYLRENDGRYHYRKVIEGVRRLGEGDIVCHAGSFEEHPWCGKVKGFDAEVEVGSSEKSITTNLTRVRLGGCGAQDGDSGGPVYMHRGNQGVAAGVNAYGLMVATSRPCGSETSEEFFATSLKRALPHLPSAGQPVSLFTSG